MIKGGKRVKWWKNNFGFKKQNFVLFKIIIINKIII